MVERREAEVIREAYSDEARTWVAPVQGFPGGIPWPIHLEAYAAYCKEWGKQTALINLPDRNCRGGFGTEELDDFVPGWRDRISEITKLRERIAELEALVSALRSIKDQGNG